MREAEEAKKLFTADEYAGFGTTQEDRHRRETVIDLFRPGGETMGVKLLKKMGWKEGQGIGPRIRRRARGDSSTETHLFPPDDPTMIAFIKKNDCKGLGYENDARLDQKVSAPTPSRSSTNEHAESDDEAGLAPHLAVKRPNKSMKRQSKKGGFGVGVLNDGESDEEDPYSMGPKISYNRTIGAEKKSKKTKTPNVGSSNPLLKSKPIFISQKKASKSDLRKCHDGRLPLDGFTLADQTQALSTLSLQDDRYKPPDVPDDWVSSKALKTRATENTDSEYICTADAAKASNTNAKSRAALLGESPLPGKSVFDYLTPAARDRLAASSGKTDLPVAKGERAPGGHESHQEDNRQSVKASLPQLDKELALQALTRGLSGWMPYSEDEGKRGRYRAFLELHAGTRDGIPEKAPNLSHDAWVAEMNEFARAAQVFKPVSDLMASRFTSSASSRASLAANGAEEGRPADSLLTKPAVKPTDPAEEAAKLGMFGPLTRSVENFYPTRLLCKRFNVKPPADMAFDPGDEGTTSLSSSGNYMSTGSKFSSAGFQTESSDHDLIRKKPVKQLAILPAESEVSKIQQRASEPVRIDADRNEALEGQRPGEAVFKAIFGSDDEDE